MKFAFTRVTLISILIVFFISNFTAAEIRTFIKEYTYEASELDSKSSCRAIATDQVKRELLEELGTYVESRTVVKDNQLDKDEITTLTAGVVQVTVLDEKWTGKEYWLKAEVKADPDDVAASINKIRDNDQLAHELEEARAEASQAMEEAESLKRQLAQATADRQTQEQYNEAVDHLAASDYFQRGSAFAVAGNYEAADNAYSQAINLQPEYTKAYINRSIIYVQLGRYDKAASDLKTASTLSPAHEDSYYKRVELSKTTREFKIARSQKDRSPDQARVVDPLQRLLDSKREERKRTLLPGMQGKPNPAYTEPSRAAAAERSYSRETGASGPGLVSEKERQGQALRKQRDLRRKQRVEEIRKNRVNKRQEKRQSREKEKETYKDRR
ncbi:MAG TPA: hypothetical protein VLZ07_01220 [Syntrophales bacterium]|nr:hypothetical protein [Syntrophales bacterium]